MEESIRISNAFGFIQLPAKNAGTSLTAFIAKHSPYSDFLLGEVTKITGLCSYRFLSAAGLMRGVVLISPKAHTIITPTMVKIGQCPGPFTLNTDLQQIGLLMYGSPDSSLLIIPVDVKSPLLVEVDT